MRLDELNAAIIACMNQESVFREKYLNTDRSCDKNYADLLGRAAATLQKEFDKKTK
jgi:hypothetical protein